MPPQPQPKPKKRLHRRLIFGVIFLVLVVSGWLLVRSYTKPAEGTVTNQAPKPVAPTEYEVQDGQALSFHHEAGYKAKTVQPSKIYTEQYVFSKVDATTASSRSLSISVRPLTNTTLADEAGYKIRKDNPTMYVPSTQDIHGEKIQLFSKATDGFEQTAFWVHDGKLLSISLGSTYTSASQLGDELTNILQSVEWH